MSYLLAQADARRIPLADRSVHCVVTSPPYFGLRDYGTAKWVGGDASCDHRTRTTAGVAKSNASSTIDGAKTTQKMNEAYRDVCGRCGAARVDDQIGLEETPRAYVESLLGVFAEVKRVMRDDATLWLNLGDSYSAHGSGVSGKEADYGAIKTRSATRPPDGLKPKDLIGIPWMVAFALRDELGFFLRSDIIWHKPNPMPESVTDRPTKAHEYLFLLSKSERYFYDAEAIKEAMAEASEERYAYAFGGPKNIALVEANRDGIGRRTSVIGSRKVQSGRNRRSVWTISTTPYSDAHFAVFPPKLIEPCVKAGTSERGACSECGGPWVRVVESERVPTRPGRQSKVYATAPVHAGSPYHSHDGDICGNRDPRRHVSVKRTSGWEPTCRHDADPVPCLVFDPFNGSGTTGAVANALGRRYVGTDLSRPYLEMAVERIADHLRPVSKYDATTTRVPLAGQLDLFGDSA